MKNSELERLAVKKWAEINADILEFIPEHEVITIAKASFSYPFIRMNVALANCGVELRKAFKPETESLRKAICRLSRLSKELKTAKCQDGNISETESSSEKMISDTLQKQDGQLMIGHHKPKRRSNMPQKYLARVWRKHVPHLDHGHVIGTVRPCRLESFLEEAGNPEYLRFEMLPAIEHEGLWYVQEAVTE